MTFEVYAALAGSMASTTSYTSRAIYPGQAENHDFESRFDAANVSLLWLRARPDKKE